MQSFVHEQDALFNGGSALTCNVLLILIMAIILLFQGKF